MISKSELQEEALVSAMEIPAPLFFLVWAFIGPISLSLGFHTLDKTDLSNSVSPVVMSFFKRSLQNILLLSLLYSLIRGNQLNYTSSYIWRGFGMISAACPGIWISSSYIPWYFSIKMMWLFNLLNLLPNMNIFTFRYPLILAISTIPALIFPRFILMILPVINLLLIGRECHMNPPGDTRLAFQMAVETSLFLASQRDERFLEIELMFSGLYVVALFYIIEPVRGERIESVVGAFVAKVKEKKLVNFIEFAIGMVGALLFQNFFRLTSFNQVAAFLYLAVAWLAILVLLRASYDFGVLNFLLGNVVVGCTVSQLGLRSTTWLACAASLLLYGLRLKLESLTVVHRPNQLPQVKLW